MAISTHAELVTAVQNWTQRDDLTSRIPEFIIMAEAAFNRGFSEAQPFRVFQQEASTQISATTTVGLTTGFPLPTDFIEARAIRSTTSPYTPLTYAPPEVASAMFNSGASGPPKMFTLEAGVLRVLPTSTAGIQLTYYQKIPALVTAPNWLIAHSPDIYLFGALLHGGVFAHDDPQIGKVIAGYNAAVNGLRQSDKMVRYGGSALQMYAA